MINGLEGSKRLITVLYTIKTFFITNGVGRRVPNGRAVDELFMASGLERKSLTVVLKMSRRILMVNGLERKSLTIVL